MPDMFEERWSDDFTKKITELFFRAGREVYINKDERFLVSVIYPKENGLLKKKVCPYDMERRQKRLRGFPA